jgi:uracil-DNA glycosylase
MDLFKGTRGPQRARILIVGEAYGATEDKFGKPFMGESGNELNNMLREAGLDPEECLYTNLINERPKDNNFKHFLIRSQEAKDERLVNFRGVFPQHNLLEAYRSLETLIDVVRPSIIIAFGNWALWGLTDTYGVKAGSKKEKNNGYKVISGIDTYRGSMGFTRAGLPRIPVLATYHPAAVLRNWPWRFLVVNDLRRVKEYLQAPLALRSWGRTPERKRHIAPEVHLVEAWCEGFFDLGHTELTLDLETYGGNIHIMGLSTPTSTALVVPFMDVSARGTKPFYPPADWTRIYQALRRLLTDPRVTLLGQNLLFDAQYLYNEFAYIPSISFDTMVAQHLLWPALRRGLDFMASLYCAKYVYWKEDRKVSLATEDILLACNYNADDLDYTEEVAEELKRQLEEEKVTHLYSDRMEMIEILLSMMIRGVRVNLATKRKQHLGLMYTLQDLINWLEGAIPNYLKPEGKKGSKPWYASETKLRELFYETLNLDPIINKDTGEPTLNREALKRLGFKYPEFKPIFGAITLFRSARVFKGTFLDAIIDNDERWRSSYTITTETGRIASSENVFERGGNLTNIPRDREPLNFYNVIEKIS